jgi:hypothetical protein
VRGRLVSRRQLLAPPPATPDCSTPIVVNGMGGQATVVVPGISTAGSGFFDPGADLAPPALPFSHLQATVTNAVVNSVTFDSPTQVTLDLALLATGLQDLTITNPDGQLVAVSGCLDVQDLPVGLQEFTVD